MDALRKAEADKKAAERTGIVPDLPLEPLTIVAPPATELRLEPLGNITGDDFETSRAAAYRAPYNGDSTQRLTTNSRFSRGDDATVAGELSFERPLATVLIDDDAPAGEASLARPEIVTPQTVFAATSGTRHRHLLSATLAFTAVVIGGVLALGYFYYLQLPVAHVKPSPRVAAQVETAPPSAPLITSSASITSAPIAPVQVLPPPRLPAATPPPTIPTPPPAADVPALMRAVADHAPKPRVPPTPPRELSRDSEFKSGEVRIAHPLAHTTGKRVAPTRVAQAYAALVAGNLAIAKRDYQAVAVADPAQLDAWLGLGAIAIQENRSVDAHHYYSKALALDAENPVANAALFALEGGAGITVSESKLKLLLDRGVDAPYVQFALGNLYARRARWPDAQQAYFAALHGMPSNPDYAFNLAVSLERLGQGAAALQYYRQAESLRATHPAHYAATVAAARIQALSARAR